MNIATKAIVTNSEIMNNYGTCRKKAESLGKIFILNDNQPDAVLFSASAYEKLSVCIEYLEQLEEKDIAKFTASISLVLSTLSDGFDTGLAPYLVRTKQITAKQAYEYENDNQRSGLRGGSEYGTCSYMHLRVETDEN